MLCDRWLRLTGIHFGLWVGLLLCAGCDTLDRICSHPPPANIPRELNTTTLPPYVIEPPDVLVIDAVRLVPKPPYKVAPLDILGIQVTETLPDQPIAGLYTVDPDGTINLGFTYLRVSVVGMTLPEVKAAIEKRLKERMLKPGYRVTVDLAETRRLEQIRGPHLVSTDGTVSMGVYGSVYVDNLTIPEAKAAIENYLGEYLLKPEISLDVSGYNSKVYYIVTDGGGAGEQVSRLPVTGKTTVLDAMSEVNGLSVVSSKHHVYLVRPQQTTRTRRAVSAGEFCPDPTRAGKIDEEVYCVDWNGIVRRGDARTNYQVLPGDRIYVMAAPLVTADTYLARVISPLERILAVVGLGNGTVREFLTPIPRNVNGVSFTPGF